MKKLYAGVHFDGGAWNVVLSWSGGRIEGEPACFDPAPDGRRALASHLAEKFQEDPSRASRVILVMHPPESDRLFEALFERKLRILPVTPGRLAFHKERLDRDIAGLSELAAIAASTGIDADILLLEATNICNFRCLYCTQDMVTRRPEKMDTDLAKRLIGEYARWGTGGLAFHLMGEPSLHPDLPEIVAHAAKHEIDHSLISNCALLDYELASAFFRRGLMRLYLSLQTFSEGQHRLKRPRGEISYDQIQRNVRDVYRARQDTGSRADIHIHIMNTSHYQPRGARIVSGKEDLRKVLCFWYNVSKEESAERGRPVFAKDPDLISDEELDAHIWPWGKYDILPGLSVSFKTADPWQQNFLGPDEFVIPAKRGGCPLLANEHQLAILCNGDVVMCCMDFDGGTRLTNVRRRSLIDIAQEAGDTRDKLIFRGEIPSHACSRCLGIRVRELMPDRENSAAENSGTKSLETDARVPDDGLKNRDQRAVDYRRGAERGFSRVVIFAEGEMLAGLKDYLEGHGIAVRGFLDGKRRWLKPAGRLMDLPVWHYARLPAGLAEAVLFPPSIEIKEELVSSLKKRLPGVVIGQVIPLFRWF